MKSTVRLWPIFVFSISVLVKNGENQKRNNLVSRTSLNCIAAFMIGGLMLLSSCGSPTDQRVERLRTFSALYGYVKYFHPSDESANLDWDAFLVTGVEQVLQISHDESLLEELKRLFSPIAPSLQLERSSLPPVLAPVPTLAANSGLFKVAWQHRGSYSAYRAGRDTLTHVDGRNWTIPSIIPEIGEVYETDIGFNIKARIPLALWADSLRTYPHADIDLLNKLLNSFTSEEEADEQFLGIAAVIKFWNVHEHFFPYFDVADVDWDQELTESLTRGLQATSEKEVLYNLDLLMAALNDGHGNVYSLNDKSASYPLPIRFDWIEDEIVVILSDTSAVEIGDVAETIGGRNMKQWSKERANVHSGSESRKQMKVVNDARRLAPIDELGNDIPDADSITIAFRRPDNSRYETHLIRKGQNFRFLYPQRDTETIQTYDDGIFYVDLDRVEWSVLENSLSDLAKAPGIIFDMRGYPISSGTNILRHLISKPDTANWMFIPVVTRPHMKDVEWFSLGWNLQPESPHIETEIVFLTNGWAMSYAESIMGFVDGYNLGTIVGTETIGANGNSSHKGLWKWRSLSTGMRVLRHNGAQMFRIGIPPDVRVEQTIKGVQAGRDEVLEEGLEILRQQVAERK